MKFAILATLLVVASFCEAEKSEAHKQKRQIIVPGAIGLGGLGYGGFGYGYPGIGFGGYGYPGFYGAGFPSAILRKRRELNLDEDADHELSAQSSRERREAEAEAAVHALRKRREIEEEEAAHEQEQRQRREIDEEAAHHNEEESHKKKRQILLPGVGFGFPYAPYGFGYPVGGIYGAPFPGVILRKRRELAAAQRKRRALDEEHHKKAQKKRRSVSVSHKAHDLDQLVHESDEHHKDKKRSILLPGAAFGYGYGYGFPGVYGGFGGFGGYPYGARPFGGALASGHARPTGPHHRGRSHGLAAGDAPQRGRPIRSSAGEVPGRWRPNDHQPVPRSTGLAGFASPRTSRPRSAVHHHKVSPKPPGAGADL